MYDNLSLSPQTLHQGRKLSWLLNLCKGELRANFQKPYIFLVCVPVVPLFLAIMLVSVILTIPQGIKY